MPAKAKTPKPHTRNNTPTMYTLDPITLETIDEVQAAHPEVESKSAAVRFLARYWRAQTARRKSREKTR